MEGGRHLLENMGMGDFFCQCIIHQRHKYQRNRPANSFTFTFSFSQEGAHNTGSAR